MRICFLGESHAAQHLSKAAQDKGFELCGLSQSPDLVFVSEDTPTDENGVRDLEPIISLVQTALSQKAPIILTSQVYPGFTRACGNDRIFHQAETLRIKDAAERAAYPEMMIVGCADPKAPLPEAYGEYLRAFQCPVLKMTYESAEFAKMAINRFLISQVETTNELSSLAEKCGADWNDIKTVLQHDARIGPKAYLDPGRWQDSKHLLRDYVTLKSL